MKCQFAMDSIAAIYASDGAARRAKAKASGMGERRRGEVIGLRRRRPPLVVAVALANKTARIAWAVMLRQKEYQPRAVAA